MLLADLNIRSAEPNEHHPQKKGVGSKKRGRLQLLIMLIGSDPLFHANLRDAPVWMCVKPRILCEALDPAISQVEDIELEFLPSFLSRH